MAETESQGPLALGQKFLKYRIRGQLGRGGYAWVYHGHDPFLDNEVAIKILHRHGGVSADMLRRGQAEARLLFRLKHPNIVEVQDAGISDDGLLYIVMELLRGQSLREVLRERGRLPLREALELFLDLTQGIEAAHAFGAIHRDLKPENVFILEDGGSKVLDFGIAKVVDVAGITTERDVLHGTILYISPEQLEGHRATPRSDLYGLGLLFFETLYGRHPLLLKAVNPTVRELSLMQIGLKPPRLNELDPDIPRHVARIVERLLMKSPAQRLQSTQELRAALGESLQRVIADSTSAQERDPIQRADTEPARVGGDTERIPCEFLPDREAATPLETPSIDARGDGAVPSDDVSALDGAALEREMSAQNGAARGREARAPDGVGSDSSEVTPVRVRPREAGAPQGVTSSAPSPDAPSIWPVTAPLPTTAVAKKSRAKPPLTQREFVRRRSRRALASGALVGTWLGIVYVGASAYIARRPAPIAAVPASASSVAVSALGPALAAGIPTPDPSPSASSAPSAAGASVEPPASTTPARQPALAVESPVPAVSRLAAVPNRPTPPTKQPRHATSPGKHARKASAPATPLDDDPHRVWIE